MVMYDFSFRSLTAAQSGRNVLQDHGIGALLARAPQSISELGCGYILQVAEPDGAQALALLSHWGIGFRRIFRQTEDGLFQEVRDDLF